MSTIGLAYPNRARGATFSGGSWLAALPASNAGTAELAAVARTNTAAATDSKLRMDLGSARTLRAFAIVNHNLTVDAHWRVLLGTTTGASDVYAGSWTDAWQITSVEAGFAALGIEDGQYLRNGFAAIMVLPAAYSARHVTIEIDDATNGDNYVQLGMAWASGLFAPAINASYGLRDAWRDLSSTEAAESGAQWDTPRRRLRSVQFVLPLLTPDEGEALHEMDRILGTVDQLLYVPDLLDTAAQQRFGFVGQLAEMRPLEYPHFRARGKGFSIAERG